MDNGEPEKYSQTKHENASEEKKDERDVNIALSPHQLANYNVLPTSFIFMHVIIKNLRLAEMDPS